MGTVLNITNGDSAVNLMQAAGIEGEFLPWRDVLHDGPVPDEPELTRLSQIRAGFIASRGWGDLPTIEQGFRERDRQLESFRDYRKVLLWFEHDLYDQLQILQILDWFNQIDLGRTRLAMICTDRYLGYCTLENIGDLRQFEHVVDDGQLALACEAWSAFRQRAPDRWFELLSMDTGCLPYLAGAVRRQLQEYPAVASGINRSEAASLELVRALKIPPGKLFGEYQKTEERMFMGDLSYWHILQGLADGSPPLIALHGNATTIEPRNRDQAISLTNHGESVLQGNMNWLDIHSIDRWIGGVHLLPDNLWLWDERASIITRGVS